MISCFSRICSPLVRISASKRRLTTSSLASRRLGTGGRSMFLSRWLCLFVRQDAQRAREVDAGPSSARVGPRPTRTRPNHDRSGRARARNLFDRRSRKLRRDFLKKKSPQVYLSLTCPTACCLVDLHCISFAACPPLCSSLCPSLVLCHAVCLGDSTVEASLCYVSRCGS